MDTKDKLILFLDIDGVLNSRRSQKKWISEALPYNGGYRHHHIEWDEIAVHNYNECIRQLKKLSEILVVLSSDWRWNNTEESNRELFNRYEIQQYESTTPTASTVPETQGVRGLEILWWLKNHAPDNHYLVIDDTDFPIRKHIDNKNFVYVNGGWQGRGFSKWHKRHAIEKANKLLGLS